LKWQAQVAQATPLIGVGPSQNHWSDEIDSLAAATPGSPWVALTWRQYLSWFGKIELLLSGNDARTIHGTQNCQAVHAREKKDATKFFVDVIRQISYISGMATIKMPKPTEAELEILNVLWKKGTSTVKNVHEAMGEQTGYTTTLKLLQIMTEKGLVTRNESQRAHVYQAKYKEADTQQQLLTVFLNKAFSGSTSRLVMQALASKRATPEELAEIKILIEQLGKENK
jgi:predicted transcriptional regulator